MKNMDMESTERKLEFKKFGGEYITDVVDYVRDYVREHPDVAVAVGCDSQQYRRSTCYVVAIVMYSPKQKNGAHVVFAREHLKKIHSPKNVDHILESMKKNGKPQFNEFKDLHPRLYGEIERVHKYANMIHDGLDGVYERPDFTEDESILYDKLVDAHLDLNPDAGNGHNKSNLLWAAGKGMLEGNGYRTFTKPNAYAASCAADLLCK